MNRKMWHSPQGFECNRMGYLAEVLYKLKDKTEIEIIAYYGYSHVAEDNIKAQHWRTMNGRNPEFLGFVQVFISGEFIDEIHFSRCSKCLDYFFKISTKVGN